MNRVATLLIVLALIASTVGCTANPVQVELNVSSSSGGTVTAPGEGDFTYDAGTVVDLVATPDDGYRFREWTGDTRDIHLSILPSTTITMNDHYSITANFEQITYDLTISTTQGGSVTAAVDAEQVLVGPGETKSISGIPVGTEVHLEASSEQGYAFVEWQGRPVDGVTDRVNAITMDDHSSITANFAKGIWDWYDLDAIRDDLSGSYVLMNNLDSTTPGYSELAGPTANGGEGWEPIGYGGWFDGPYAKEAFKGVFSGQGYAIADLIIRRPNEDYVALFGCLDVGGVAKDVRVTAAAIIGQAYVGGLVGQNHGILSNSHSGGTVTGDWSVGGLAGENSGTVSDCHFSGSVAGESCVGGLLGRNWATVTNSHYNYDEVRINGHKVITIGALFRGDFEEWLANDKFLDVSKRLVQTDGYYVIDQVSSLKQLLAFGQDSSLRFRLTSDLDLAHDPDFHIPYLAGEFDGNGHRIAGLRFRFGFVAHVGLFGCLASSGELRRIGVEDADIRGSGFVGSLVGLTLGSVRDSYASGRVTGNYEVGGLVGLIAGSGTLDSSCFVTGTVNGHVEVGGLMGAKWSNLRVSNSYYNHDKVLINARKTITTGALFGDDFDEWLSNGKFFDVAERLSQEDGYCLIRNTADLRQLLIFGQDASLRFRLMNDLDLGGVPGFYIPYLAGQFDGNGHRIANLNFGSSSTAQVGLFGYLAPGGVVSNLRLENVSISGARCIGGLVGLNDGTVIDSRASGSVTGTWYVGGLVGHTRWGSAVRGGYSAGSVTGSWGVGGLIGSNDHGSVSRSYSSGVVKASRDVGGLVGINWMGTVIGCYSTGMVVGSSAAGGLVGRSEQGTTSNSFWDRQTSGMEVSDGGTGKTTAEMRSIAMFSGAGWNIVAVAPGERDTAYIWNIVDGQTYPSLSWESAS